MRAVLAKIAGKDVELRLSIDNLDQIATVNPYFGEMAQALAGGAPWDWREVRVVLTESLRPHGLEVQAVVDECGVEGAQKLAAEVFLAAMPKGKPGKP